MIGYIPQANVTGNPFPILLCDVDSINPELIGWADPYSSYDRHNIIFDTPKVAQMKRTQNRGAFNGDSSSIGRRYFIIIVS